MLQTGVRAALEPILSSVPTLPVGQGALILIVGGTFAAGIALVWTLLMPREVPVRAMRKDWPHARQRLRPRPVRTERASDRIDGSRGGKRSGRPVPVLAWLAQVNIVTSQHGLGEVEPIRIWDDDRCRLRLTHCRSCRGDAARVGCEEERQLIESEMERFVANPEVVEVRCRAREPDEACTFDVHAGGATSP